MDYDKRLLTAREAADLLHIKPQTLAMWRRLPNTDRRFIEYIRIGRNIRYRYSDLMLYIAKKGNYYENI